MLLLTDRLDIGGAETHILTLACALRTRGIDVSVASSGGRIAQRLQEEGIPHHTLPDCRSHHFVRYLLTLRRLCRTHRFSLLHAHARMPALAAHIIAKRYALPTVVTVHAQFRSDHIRRRLSRWGVQTIAVSEDLKQYLCEAYGIFSDHIHVIPNGIQPQSPLSPPDEDKPRLVFCSRLDNDCAAVAFLLCEIAKPLKNRFPSLEILFIGGGNALPVLRRKVDAINAAFPTPFLFCLGASDDPIRHLRASDVFIGVSRAAMEAMSVGVPVILAGNEGFGGVADGQALLDAARSNFCCRAMPLPDEASLFQACTSLLSRSLAERITLGKRLATYIQAHHSIEHVAEQTEAIYRKAIVQYNHIQAKHQPLVLCGYYGYGNLGDETLLRAAVARAHEQFPTLSITALTAKGKRDETRLGVQCVRRTNPLSVAKQIRHASHFVFGGGTILQETTSLRSLLYYTALLRYAQGKGIRCELWANGLEEPHSRLGRHLMRSALCRCSRVGLRDERSVAWAHALGIDEKKIVREDDLALGLPPCEQGRTEFLLNYYQLQTPFAIIVPKETKDSALHERFAEELRALREKQITLLFVPFFPKEDLSLCQLLCHAENEPIATDLSARDLIGLMQESDGVYGMRLHALIFAQNAHVPFVGFGNDPKIESFCLKHGAKYFH